MKYLRSLIIALAAVSAGCSSSDGTALRVSSPDGSLVVEISAADSLTYAVTRHGLPLLDRSAIGMRFADGRTLGRDMRPGRAACRRVARTVRAPFYRQAEFEDEFNELRLALDDRSTVVFRVYDDGCAYRFETSFDGECTVENEIAEFNFSGRPVYTAAFSDGMCNAFQFCYDRCQADSLRSDKPIILPLAVDCGPAGRVLVCESDLESYPGMFLTPTADGLRGLFACVPDSCYNHSRRCQRKVATRHDFIARTAGARTYPWRILVAVDDDAQLPVNNLVYALASENRIGDTSWIKPGKSAWEWWNDYGLADAGFKPGVNTATYKAYIDFAAEYGLEYAVLDEGWYDPAGGDVMTVIPDVDLEELIGYASSKNVGLFLWAVANVLDDKLEEACEYYSGLGIKGFKVDFIDRDDQLAVELVYRLASVAAEYRLQLDLHGIYKPTGLNRTYPNILNFEGVFGLEEVKWSNPDMPSYDVTFPFIRMVQGPVDYTPGAYRNATRDGFAIDYRRPMSQGTRAHQAAAYVVFDSPLAMLCDSPSLYEAEPDCTRFIASIPVACDRTEIVAGRMGEYIVTARRCGEEWYVGGMTDWTPRELGFALSFLDEDRAYTAEILADSDTSDVEPQRYVISRRAVDSRTTLDMRLAPGGGFAIAIRPRDAM
ncbi:MAG: glycoside hydrolase family 97 protein [Alistipes sp.]|nr:glycoside hydrolase family 97 protein [Alistipes sp.]MDE6857510.1 glycoside hydrolase family 97 protein [Alistipes sp.]